MPVDVVVAVVVGLVLRQLLGSLPVVKVQIIYRNFISLSRARWLNNLECVILASLCR